VVGVESGRARGASRVDCGDGEWLVNREAPFVTFAVCFTNFGPYHLARLRALAVRLGERGDRLVAYEVAGREERYPWSPAREDEGFAWVTLFPDRVLETIDRAACRRAIVEALDRDEPDALGIVGYVRPEAMAAARWAKARRRPAILMSESQAIDRPSVWWKEFVKKRRLRRFDAALVGGPPHRDYLVELGMPPERIVLGYNAVDNDHFAAAADRWRRRADGRAGLPAVPYFLSACRFVPEKNLLRLIAAFARYRAESHAGTAWDLVICGGGAGAAEIEAKVAASGCAPAIHLPGFLQADALARWHAHAGAFVLPSLSEPWGLVVNEAAACGLPLLVSRHAGCASTLVPEPDETCGSVFDPLNIDDLSDKLSWMAGLPEAARRAMGRRAAETVSRWGPDRFASGFLEAVERARVKRAGLKERRLAPRGTG
jgi:glycosyltransferase involved in cell wall biosynthesis